MAESYTEQHHRICAYGRPTQVNKAGFGEKKKGLCSILARYHTWVRWQLHQIALAGSSPEQSWGSQFFGWLPDR